MRTRTRGVVGAVAVAGVVALPALLGTSAVAHQRSWPGKRLAEVLPEAKTFAQRQVVLAAAQIAWIEKNLGERIRTEDRKPIFYVGTGGNGRSVGVVVFVDAVGPNGKIELGLALDPIGAVVRAILFEHSERATLGSRAFLGQFAGRRVTDRLKLGADLTSPPGDERAAQAIATAVRRGLLLAAAGLRLGVR